MPRDDIKAVSG